MNLKFFLCGAVMLVSLFSANIAGAQRPVVHRQIVIPDTDRFTPFSLTIRAGDKVIWETDDTDDHTIVSLDSANTIGPRGVNYLLPGTENNNGRPGQVYNRFMRPGTWTYYCRFHSHLDSANQPVAPGPDGGIQDANGNFGTPMMGIIVVR